MVTFFKTVNDVKWKLQWNLILLIMKVKLNKLGSNDLRCTTTCRNIHRQLLAALV